ncbi:MAG: GntR family transcriptional regulator, partial [Acidimicrobiia bacterium]|nr:GntR family transcriptional regulator [Acidimicrobiia bacterium]
MPRPDSITDDLRRDILAGVYPPGERLVELQLTDRYGCGRATVRSALIELTAEGLVEREANRGATVRRITIAEAIEITESRAALESLIAAHAARNATDDERSELIDVIDRMRTAVAAADSGSYSELNALLHRRLREMSRHSVASHLVQNLRNRA